MALDKQHQSSLPFIIGQVAFFAMATAPAGFLKCAGQAVSRATYADLFAAIGTLYGAGNGSTTFNLPDLRGEFLRCLDDGRGIDAGRALGSAQVDSFKSHQHRQRAGNETGTSGGYGRFADGSGNIAVGNYTEPFGGTETRPRNIALLACIFTGI